MVMFLLSFVKGVQIRGGESISAGGFGPGGPNPLGQRSPIGALYANILSCEMKP